MSESVSQMPDPIRPDSRSSRVVGKERRTYDLPRDLIQRAGQRLGAAALLGALAFAVSFPVMNLAPPPSAGNLDVANVVAAVSVGFCLLVFVLTRRKGMDPERLLDFGLVFEVVMGFAVAFAETYATYDPYGTVRGVSWVCLWIALFPLVVPSTPGKTLIAALATATMGPVALMLAVTLGAPSPSAVTFVYLSLPNFFAAGLAVVLSRIINRLGSDVTRARQMGSYQLVKRLGRGGMGEVWVARHRTLARPAAIKLVKPEVLAGRTPADSKTALKRFEREARVTAGLSSPHTIQIFDFGVTSEGALYYVMELLDGIDLETLVETHGPVSPERAVHLLRQACESLAEAHESGLVHRDIKPANIYVCRLGTMHDRVKVLDFGLVAFESAFATEKTRLTAEGTVTGTPAYMAPEVATGDRPIDHRVDIYSLGCVAYWMLTGELVFEGSPLQVLYGHVEKEPPRPSLRVDQDIPDALEQVVLSCLAKEPDERPASARVLAGRLAALELSPWTEDQASEWWVTHPIELREPDEPVDVLGETILPASDSLSQ